MSKPTFMLLSLLAAGLMGCATEEEPSPDAARYHLGTFCGPAGGNFTKVIKSEGEPACAAVHAEYPQYVWLSLPQGWTGDTTFQAKAYSGDRYYDGIQVRYKATREKTADSLMIGTDAKFMAVRRPDGCEVTTPCI